MAKSGSRLVHAWNAFVSEDSAKPAEVGMQFGGEIGRQDRLRFRFSHDRSIISSIYTRLSIDVASVIIRHIREDDKARFLEEMNTNLNDCFKTEPNLDQGPRHFRQNIALTLFDKGVAAIVPVDTTMNPLQTGGYDIQSLRVGEIMAWYPAHIRVRLYDERHGVHREILLPKRNVAIVENPFYNVMNEPNSTLQRLIRKLNLLDTVDEQTSSGKLDLIIQAPYAIKSDARREQALRRRKDIEEQLRDSKYGIAQIDGTEKITQLNRPVENNLLAQVEFLIEMLYGQLGLTKEIMNGTADEKAMLNYLDRTIEPIMDAIVESMRRTFLTKTARTQRQSITYFRSPFKLVPLSQMAEIADKFTRNEIVSSNEMRGFLGMTPSTDPKADELRNSNMPQASPESSPADPVPTPEEEGESEALYNEALDSVNSQLDSVFETLQGAPGG